MTEPASATTSEPCTIDARMLQVMMAAAAYQARRVGRTLKLSQAAASSTRWPSPSG